MYKYDICILSHPSDAAEALRLADSIKKYRLPKNTVPANTSADFHKILLDTDGRALDAEAEAALDQCRQLIVLCSPAVKEYAPVLDKLIYFERQHDRESMVAVIIRGEPIDSFPAFFIEEKLVRRIKPDGSIEERIETQEPVASDLRARTGRQARALLRYETVRIVASLLGLEPDELEQRHAKRRKRRRTAIAAAVCGLCLVICATFVYFSGLARREGDVAAAMTAESQRVIDRLVDELPGRFEGDAAAQAAVQSTIDEALELFEDSGDAPSSN